MEAIDESDSEDDFPTEGAGPSARREAAWKSPPSATKTMGRGLERREPVAGTQNRTVFGNYRSSGRGTGGEGSPGPGGLLDVAGLATTNAARARGFAMPEGFATPGAAKLRGAMKAEGTPVSAQQFLAAVLPTAGSAPMPSSARRVTPKKGTLWSQWLQKLEQHLQR